MNTEMIFIQILLICTYTPSELRCGSAGKESTCNVEGLGLIPGLGRSPREGKGYPLQYSGLVRKESDRTEQLSLSQCLFLVHSMVI